MVATIAIILIDPPVLAVHNRGSSFNIRFAASYFLVTAFTYFFEQLRDRAQKMHLRRGEEAEAAEREAVRANAAKTDFLAKVSHELRTPLNHIIGFTDLLRNERTGMLNMTQAEYLKDVSESGKHLLGLINDVLDISKVEAGKIELQPELLSARQLIQNCISVYTDVASQQGVSVVFEDKDSDASVFADERRLTQVLYNLFTNALKHTDSGGSITFRLSEVEHDQGQSVLISVADTGDGIEPDDLERIFELFESADGALYGSEGGVGIGLALSKNLIDMHGGAIWAESAGKGKGSTFKVLLPTAAGTGSSSSSMMSPHGSSAGR
jgi:signal transduction histidine kinase